MTIALYAIAPVLYLGLMLASFLTLMYSEALSLRGRGKYAATEGFSAVVQPRLGLTPDQGRARFSAAQLGIIVLLSIDLFYLSALEATPVVATIEAVALSVLAVVVGAIAVPVVLATRSSGRWAGRLTWVSRLLGWCAAPMAFAGSVVTSIASVGDEVHASKQEPEPSEEIDALLAAGLKEGLIDGEDRKLIHSVVGFGDKTVREVMTPRPNVVAISAESNLEEVRALIRKAEHSRIPVYSGSIDEAIGFIHGRDTMDYTEEERTRIKAGEAMRPILLIPESKRIPELMREMQEARAQIAMVVDEYGQTAGLVTMEDMMEEIVGEIEDETDPTADVLRQKDDSLILNGGLDLDRLEDLVGYRPRKGFTSTTIGGLVCEQLGQVPVAGAKVRLEQIELEVLASNERRVERVQLRRREKPDSRVEGTG